MRHELVLGEWIVTTDNSAGIGEKPMDTVAAPDRLTAKFATRVALLEQWAAGSEAEAVLLHNFSGADQWAEYVDGIEELLEEAGLHGIPVTGSSETNIETLQSGIAVTIFGKRTRSSAAADLDWFVYGVPLSGEDVLERSWEVADMRKLREALQDGIVERVWPVGSKGVAHETELLLSRKVQPVAEIDIFASGGPSSCVLLGVRPERIGVMEMHFGNFLFPIK
ncbi:MAG TPA: alpha-ribazole-5-phosphate synthase [Planococcus sp. (in: firmicutes)]|nr:alpha-ribazole-5-phosphate synthase [Planococcus sp. (in: firmicutes)]